MKSNTNTSPLIMSKVITVLSLALLGATYSGLASAACTTDLDLGGQNITNIGTLSGASGSALTIGSDIDAGGNSITTTGTVNVGTAVNAGTLSVGLANNTYTLPTNRGTNGQVLTTDGAGATSWQTISNSLETVVFTNSTADFTAITSTNGYRHNFNATVGGTNPSVRVFKAIVTSYSADATRSASVDVAIKHSASNNVSARNACTSHNNSTNAAGGHTQSALVNLTASVVNANDFVNLICRFNATNLHTNSLFFSFGIYGYGT